jgi:transcription elongation GreA/GreB family factor
MLFKQKVYTHCLRLLNEKIHSLKNIIQELSESAMNDTKSSAGDKHETGRAMIQIEQETLGKQLNEAEEQKALLEKIDITNNSIQIHRGSLVKTNNGYLFLSIPFGKITVDNKTVIVISPQSPLGKKLMGLGINDSTNINGTNYNVESIY